MNGTVFPDESDAQPEFNPQLKWQALRSMHLIPNHHSTTHHTHP